MYPFWCQTEPDILKCYPFDTLRNYPFSYKSAFGRIIRIRLTSSRDRHDEGSQHCKDHVRHTQSAGKEKGWGTAEAPGQTVCIVERIKDERLLDQDTEQWTGQG